VSRFTNKAHTEQIQAADRGTTGAKRPGAPPPCAVCHEEHQGLDAGIAEVRSTACRTCHLFRSLGSGHPEFGILRLQRPDAPGISFPHRKHLEELAKRNILPPRACETCHHPTAGDAEFTKISFDRDCADCHVKDGTIGETAPFKPEMVVTAEAISASDPAASWAKAMTDEFGRVRDRLVKRTIHHRDAWILYNTTRLGPAAAGVSGEAAPSQPPREDLDAKISALRAEIDPKIAALRSELADVEHARSDAATAQDSSSARSRVSQLEERMAALSTEIAGLDTRLAQASPDTSAPAALAPTPAPEQIRASLSEIDAVISLLGTRTEPWAREEGQRLVAKRQRIESLKDQTGPGWSAAGLSSRRADLKRRLDDLARIGAPPAEVAAIRRELDAPGGSAVSAPGAGSAIDAAQIQASLSEVDSALAVLDSRTEPWAREESERLRVKRNALAARSDQPSPGWAAGTLGERRSELGSMIDALAKAGAPANQVAELRRQLSSLAAPQPGSGGSEVASLRADRDSRARALDSAKREVARLKATLDQPSADPRQTADLDLRRSQIEGEIHALEDLSKAPAPALAASIDPAEAAKTIDIILKPCLKCHVEVNHAIRKTELAQSVLPAATFTHKPHVRETACLDCHGKVAESEDAADLSLTGVATCRNCHKAGGPSDSCRTCHRYHPSGSEGLLASARVPGGPS